MQSVLREKLLIQAIRLAEISRVYRTESHRFVDAYFVWLENAARDLSSLRSPIVILLQAETSSLTSVLDGNMPSGIQTGNSIRKCQKAAAAQSLERISKEIYTKIEQIDQSLEQFSEKFCHAIAVLASKDPALFEDIQANQQGIITVWNKLGQTPETIPIYNYFCAALSTADRDYLLLDIIQNVVNNRL